MVRSPPIQVVTMPAMPPATGADAGRPFGIMLRGALVPSTVAGIVTVIVVVALRGQHALAGAVFGLVVALAFFGLGMLVLSRLVRDSSPVAFFAVAMTVYLGQVIGLLLVILVVRDADWVDRRGMGIVVGVVTVLWQVFAIRAYRGARIPVYDGVSLPTPGSETISAGPSPRVAREGVTPDPTGPVAYDQAPATSPTQPMSGRARPERGGPQGSIAGTEESP